LPAPFTNRVLRDIQAATATGPLGYMGILAVSDARGVRETIQALPDTAQTIDYPERVANALTHGVPIGADDLKYLYDLELRTWAPTSERSRSQAGYGVY